MAAHLFFVFVALTSACSWAVGTILFKGVSNQLSANALTLAKSVAGTGLLAVGAILAGWSWMAPGTFGLLCLSGFLGISCGDALFFACLRRLNAHQVVVLMMLGPALTVFLAVLFLGERPSTVCWAGFILVLLGVTITSQAGLREPINRSVSSSGLIFGLLAVLCMSVSTIVAKAGLREVPAVQGSFVRMLAGAVGLGMVCRRKQSWQEIGVLLRRDLLCRFVVAVLVVTFGGFWLSLVAIKHLPVSVANILFITEPLFALPLAVFCLDERPLPQAWSGAAIAWPGALLLAWAGSA